MCVKRFSLADAPFAWVKTHVYRHRVPTCRDGMKVAGAFIPRRFFLEAPFAGMTRFIPPPFVLRQGRSASSEFSLQAAKNRTLKREL
jgi:hypothetical protein